MSSPSQPKGVSAIDSRSMHERVYEELRRSLLQGGFVAGQSLTIRGLAALFGTSEMPVREAIKRLVAERMVVQLSNRTFQVPELEWEQFEELLVLRISLEGLAARRAAAGMSDVLLGKLTRFNLSMKIGLQNKDYALALKSNQEFHFALYSAVCSPIMMELIEMMWLRSGPYLAQAMFKFDDAEAMFERAAQIHDRLISELVAGNEEGAFSALSDDLCFAARWYEDRAGATRTRAPDVIQFPLGGQIKRSQDPGVN